MSDRYDYFAVKVVIPCTDDELQKQSSEYRQLHTMLMKALDKRLPMKPCICCKGSMIDPEGFFDGGMAFISRRGESPAKKPAALGGFVCFQCLDAPDTEQRIVKAIPGCPEIVHAA